MNKSLKVGGWTDDATAALTRACEQLNLAQYRSPEFKIACEKYARNPRQPRPVDANDVKSALRDWQITAALRKTAV